jgi:FHS family L-fucose permease-like MFS transporter
MASIGSSNENLNYNNTEGQSTTLPLVLMVTLFFVFGIITVLNDILIPHFKDTFHLNWVKAMLINFCFFGAYFIMGIPSSWLINKLGYKKAIVFGLCVVSAGCMFFLPASKFLSYELFLFSLFFIASGITLLQVAANAYVTVLGAPEKASSRISLCGGLNSSATIIGPLIGAALILNQFAFDKVELSEQNTQAIEIKTQNLNNSLKLVLGNQFVDSIQNIEKSSHVKNTEILTGKDKEENDLFHKVATARNNAKIALEGGKYAINHQLGEREMIHDKYLELKEAYEECDVNTNKAKAGAVGLPYVCLSIFVLIIAFVFYKVKLPEIITTTSEKVVNKYSAWSFRHLKLGVLAIFIYVGAEVVVGSLMISYIGLDNILGLPEKDAAKYVSLYWGSAAVARFLGFVVLQKVSSSKALVFTSLLAAGLVANAILTDGLLSLSTLIALGLCHSVMWPIIFSLSLDGLGKYKTEGSGLLIMGVVGGAIIPMIQGVLIDTPVFGYTVGLQNSFAITFLCYVYLVYYALIGYKNVNQEISLEANESN